MKRLFSAVKTAAKWQRLLAFILTLVFMLSAVMTGTAAWSDMSQHKTNIAQGEGSPKLTNAILQKYEKDKDGKETETPVPGAEFTLYRVNADGTATRMDTYITGTDGQVFATDLEPGDYYWQETRPATGFLPETENGQPKKYPFSVPSENGEPVFSTAYNTRRQGKLALTKTVKNSDNSALTAAQKDMLFEFTVTFSDGGSYAYSIDGGTARTVASGGKIYLKSGQTAQFDDIPAGIRYQIDETPVSGYTTGSENNAGNVPEDGITAAFTNTYNSIPDDSGSLTVTKSIDNGELAIDPDMIFEFTAVIGDKTETFILRHGEQKVFDNIPVGTSYVITENDYSADHYTATVKEYSGTINAKDEVVVLPFRNVYDGEPDDKTGSLVISKTVTGNHADFNKEFTFTVTFTGEGAPASPQTFTLKHGQSKTFDNIPQGVQYTVTETASGGYYPDFTVASGVIAGDQTITVAYQNCVPAEDDFELTVTKRVDGNTPEEDKDKLFHFILTINGIRHEFDLKSGEISEAFTVHPGDVYSLAEQDYTADGYVQSGVINGSGVAESANIEIIQYNSYVGPEYIDIDGKKTWNTTGAPAGIQMPDGITVLLKNGDVTERTTTVNQDSNWEYEFKDLPKYDALGNEIIYTVEEVRIPGWRPVVSGYDIENVYQLPVTEDGIEVEKVVTGTNPPADEIFAFILTPVNGAPMPNSNEINITGAGKASFGEIIYTQPSTYIYTITETDGGVNNWSYDVSVYTLTVTVTEDSNGQLRASKTLEKNGTSAENALFTNRYSDSGETVSVHVTKVWKGEDDNRPQSVQVQLYKDGTPCGDPVTLSAANNWTQEWSGLDQYSAWTVDEGSVPEGYAKAVSGDQVNGFVITNTKTAAPEEEEVTVSGKKTWNHGDNPVDKRPASITLIIKANGVIVAQRRITEAEQWRWSFCLPKYDSDGKEIVYTVDEALLEDYVKTVDGYSLINTYRPGTSTEDPDPSSPGGNQNGGPKTGDESNRTLWIILMITSLIAIVAAIIPWRRKWNGNQYVPKY